MGGWISRAGGHFWAGVLWLPRKVPALSRLVVVLLGVVLVAVPTAFAIFPAITTLWILWRVFIALAWLLVAVFAVALAAISDERVRESAAAGDERTLRAEHRDALRDQLSRYLAPAVGGLPACYDLTLYGPSPDGAFLIPLYPMAINSADPAIFPVDAGAAGAAWGDDTGTVVVVSGDAVWDATHGLTAYQSRVFRSYRVVAAVAILDERDAKIGVLTAITREDDDFFDDEERSGVLREVAQSISWLVPNAVKWLILQEDEVE